MMTSSSRFTRKGSCVAARHRIRRYRLPILCHEFLDSQSGSLVLHGLVLVFARTVLSSSMSMLMNSSHNGRLSGCIATVHAESYCTPNGAGLNSDAICSADIGPAKSRKAFSFLHLLARRPPIKVDISSGVHSLAIFRLFQSSWHAEHRDRNSSTILIRSRITHSDRRNFSCPGLPR